MEEEEEEDLLPRPAGEEKKEEKNFIYRPRGRPRTTRARVSFKSSAPLDPMIKDAKREPEH